MNFRRIAASLAIVAVTCLLFGIRPLRAGTDVRMVTYTMFNGAQPADSTAQASYWIPIKGARRIVLKSWTIQGVTAADDSAYADSLSAFTLLFGDSSTGVVYDSSGTIISTANRSGRRLNQYPSVKDSVVLSGATNAAADTIHGVAAYHLVPASGQALKWSTTQGWYTWVYPIMPSLAAWGAAVGAEASNRDAVFAVGYMRARYTPLSRVSNKLVLSDSRIHTHTQGVHGFKMIAEVYYPVSN